MVSRLTVWDRDIGGAWNGGEDAERQAGEQTVCFLLWRRR